ncbi:lanthionine synthetase LanC family protein [Rheinheimera pacifica]|uniref:lanthionine synthetase LanC family protein n=1 Tax=Rheinheimera pacifica TaxID=173990 RepID=UPI002EDB77AA
MQQTSVIHETESIVRALINEIQNIPEKTTSSGLLNGLSGHLLFLWYAGKFLPEQVSESLFNKRLSDMEIVDHTKPFGMSFGLGITGIAWLYETFLQDQINSYQPEFNQNTDILVQQYLEQVSDSTDIEYVLGVSGIAVYLARRNCCRQALGCSELLISVLQRQAHFLDETSCAWNTPPSSIYRFNKDNNNPEFNLGLAHGVPAVLSALIALHGGLTRQKATAEKLLNAGCNWLLAQRQDPQRHGCYFGNVAEKPSTSRLGWCYGDLAIALTLFRAGHLLQRDDLIRAATEICLHASHRTPEQSFVQDAAICHGIAGLALSFRLLSEYCTDPQIKLAEQFWHNELFKLYRTQGVKGFYRFGEEEGQPTYLEDASLLNGYAGIGLYLLTTLGQKADWTEALLLQ